MSRRLRKNRPQVVFDDQDTPSEQEDTNHKNGHKAKNDHKEIKVEDTEPEQLTQPNTKKVKKTDEDVDLKTKKTLKAKADADLDAAHSAALSSLTSAKFTGRNTRSRTQTPIKTETTPQTKPPPVKEPPKKQKSNPKPKEEELSPVPSKKGQKKAAKSLTEKPKKFNKKIFNTETLGNGDEAPSSQPVIKAEEDADDVFLDIEKVEGNLVDYNDFNDPIPEWAIRENVRDAEGRTKEDPDYDPSTLFIPVGALDNLSPLMKQYWQIKCQNFDKIFLFKIGGFYRMFYEDALICHKELDLNWLGSQMIVGIPQRTLDKYAHELVNRGYRLCVAEQVENQKGKERRIKQLNQTKEKIVQRKVAQYISKGNIHRLQWT